VGEPSALRDRLLAAHPEAQLIDLAADPDIESLAARLAQVTRVDHIVWLAPQHSEEPCIPAMQLFRLIKALFAAGLGSRPLSLTLVTVNAQPVQRAAPCDPPQAAVHGLAGSLAKECVRWELRVIDLPAEADCTLDAMLTLPADPAGNIWALRSGDWHRQRLIRCLGPDAPAAFRRGGVYAIVGGAGGIGEAFSEYLVRRYQARVVWLGRRAEDDVIREKIARLAALGPAPVYLRADGANRLDMERACREIRRTIGAVHGVIHSAIVLRDKGLLEMDEARFREALDAKLATSVTVAQAFAAEDLDFMLFFSSLQSFLKAPGQSNYAAGCTFADAFAHKLGARGRWPVKVMNWGYWGTVGTVASDEYRARLRRMGLDSVEPEEGMQAIERLLAGGASQLVFARVLNTESLGELVDEQECVTLAAEGGVATPPPGGVAPLARTA
jgi:NAD(P)-dependent dehydrogenase (short-subunit alcohol dehydrogenase family)